MATQREWKQRGRESKNGLPDKVEIALGMKVMVTTNIDMDLDVANGSRGEIVGIALDPQEEKTGSSAIVALEYPPTYILVKLQRTRSSRLRSVRLHRLPIPGTNNTLVKIQSAYCATL
ncbi:hypothetical protein K439DRAFT_1637553, partial [Ramaria rubella]